MQAGGSVVSKEASQAPPARCEATIANLTEAKQEGDRLRWMRLRPLGALGSALQPPMPVPDFRQIVLHIL